VVDHGSARVPWLQVYDFLRERIDSGEFPPGARLPSIMTLSQDYGAAGVTVRKALAKLRDEGRVISIPGWGNFTTEHPPGKG
jgi:GntR family transcriptional regulator